MVRASLLCIALWLVAEWMLITYKPDWPGWLLAVVICLGLSVYPCFVLMFVIGCYENVRYPNGRPS